jgi:cytochrome c-type biogenesis protein CcmH/NrfG
LLIQRILQSTGASCTGKGSTTGAQQFANVVGWEWHMWARTKYEQVIPVLEHSLQLEGNSWDAHWTLARAYYHQQNYDGALKESQERSTVHAARLLT